MDWFSECLGPGVCAGDGVEHVIESEVVHGFIKIQRTPKTPVTGVQHLNPGGDPGHTLGLHTDLGSSLDSFPVSFPDELYLALVDVVVPVRCHLAGGCLLQPLLAVVEHHRGQP